MVSTCCCCGIPMQKAALLAAIADIIFGILNFVLIAVHISHLPNVETKIKPTLQSRYRRSSFAWSSGHRSSFGYGYGTSSGSQSFLPFLDTLPYWLVMTIAICHLIQFVMGVILFFAAVMKHRGTLIFWMIITTIMALFTGLLIRLLELLIVNEFCGDVKREHEVTPLHSKGGRAQPMIPVSLPQPLHNTNHIDTIVPPMTEACTSISMISGQNGTSGGPAPGHNHKAAIRGWEPNPQNGFDGLLQQHVQMPNDSHNPLSVAGAISV